MGKWLYCWELGSGMGHLRRMAGVARALADRGEQVTWCVRRPFLDAARSLWPDVIPAPQVAVGASPPWPASYAELLQGEGWNHLPALKAWVQGWETVFAQHADSRLLADFAPNAVLAAMLRDRPIDVVGTGFYTPPDIATMPVIRVDDSVYPDRPAMIEALILEQVQRLFTQQGRSAPARLASVFHAGNIRHRLCTEAALDHYGERPGVDYAGIPSAGGGAAPTWQSGGVEGMRVFAYLKPVQGLEPLLDELDRLDADILVHGDAAVGRTVAASSRRRLRWQAGPVDERSLAGACTLAINHAGHDGSAKLVRAGVPLLQLPLNIEQSLVARRIEALGAGRWIAPGAWSRIAEHLRAVLEEVPSMRHAGQRAACEWHPFDTALDGIVARLLDDTADHRDRSACDNVAPGGTAA